MTEFSNGSNRATCPGRPAPNVVALGGGYGLSTTLRAVRQYTTHITGVVSVADDGGSSGHLREAFGLPAPGDIRRCIAALADPSSVWARTLEHRFKAPELASGLDGHPVGNLLLAGLTEVLGDFTSAIEETMKMAGAVGRLLPATVEPVVLRASYRSLDERLNTVFGEVRGEAAVGQTSGITHLALVPEAPQAHPDIAEALAQADQIIIGPGSLYTSILAVLCVPTIRSAFRSARGRKIYVANLGEQHPETTGYDVGRHVDALASHGVEVDVVVRDPNGLSLGHVAGPTVIDWPIANTRGRLHDPDKLAQALGQFL
jgi:uncharacterized cofD-like protein